MSNQVSDTSGDVNPRLLTGKESRAQETYHLLSCPACYTDGAFEALSPEAQAEHIGEVYELIARDQDRKTWGIAEKKYKELDTSYRFLGGAFTSVARLYHYEVHGDIPWEDCRRPVCRTNLMSVEEIQAHAAAPQAEKEGPHNAE